MKKLFLIIISIIPLAASLFAACNPPPYYENAKKVFPAVVRVIAGDSMGSGVILSADGTVLTGQHVVGDSITALVLLNNGAQYEGKVAAADTQRDLAVIKLPVQAGTLPTAVLGKSEESDELQTGSPVLVLGYPAENQINNLALTTGIICSFRRIESVAYLQSEAKVYPGSSGGPMLNSNGEVIGIINSKYVGMEGSCATFATASSEVSALLNDLSKPPVTASPSGPAISNIRSDNVTSSSAVILWETSVPATGGVEFGQANLSRFNPSSGNKPVTFHMVQLTGLFPRETYHYRIFATDTSGRETVSAEQSLTTERTSCASVGCRAPDFNLATTDGKTISLNSLKGKKAILIFTTTKCPTDCRINDSNLIQGYI